MMSDIVLVALISVGGTVAVSLISQFLTILAANRQRDHQERLEERRWQQAEAARREAFQQAEAVRKEALRNERLRELWGYALTAHWLILDLIERQKNPASDRSSPASALELPASVAGRAYAVALTGLPAAIPAAKRFYTAVTSVQLAIQDGNNERAGEVAGELRQAIEALDACVAALAQGEPNEASQFPF
jgi:hypothetical protein